MPSDPVQYQSGFQFSLSHGAYRAEIATVGATLRSLTHSGRDLVVPFEADELRPVFRGATLAPWPNRVIDGRYEWLGQLHQLGLTEPERGHALHGLLVWQDFTAARHTNDSVRLIAVIEPQTGYPWRVEVTVDYWLDDAGLHQRVSGTNRSSNSAPFGVGPHPYLVAGPGRVDDWTLELRAETILAVVGERLLPDGQTPVTAERGQWDFRNCQSLNGVNLDHAFTDLSFDELEQTEAILRGADGAGVKMTWDRTCPWVQVHTADRPEPDLDRLGLAVEPMTCPPAAFNTGEGIIPLEPGQTKGASWSICAI